MKDIFDDIVSKKNLKNAYFDLTEKFDASSKSSKYKGIDGAILNDYNYSSVDLLEEVADEINSFTAITPASCFYIPKKNGGKRNIYIYSIKERIKAEAIYRVLEPILNQYVSNYVYSYRSSHPSYYAARSVVRRYKRYFSKNYIFTADLSDYTDSMDHGILLQKIKQCDLDERTLKMITLFIKGPILDKGKISYPEKGLMTGTPLSGLLSNLFMSEFDSWAGKYVSLYRRIGDDMVAMDPKKERIELVYGRLKETISINKLKLNTKKVFLSDDSHPFVFLGYRFFNGKVSFDPKSIRRILLKWKIDLYRYPGKRTDRKLRHLEHLISLRPNTLSQEFNQLIKQKMLVDDQEQIKSFSEKFYRLLTKYFFGRYTPKNRRELFRICEGLRIESFFSHYYKIHFPKTYAKK